MLEITGLHAGYGEVPVLHGVDLQVMPGEIVTLLGSNGVGKTTLNNNVSGIYRPTAGSIRFDGHGIVNRRPDEIVEAGLIHVPEGRRVFTNLSIRENLVLGSYRRAAKRRDRNLERVYSLFPRLAERAAQKAGTLSGGEQQMLAIGRGLMGEPRLLILDEPSLGLSPRLVDDMFAMIRRLNAEGLAILLVEQNVMMSLETAHRAYVMEHGQVVMQGRPADLLQNPELKRAYLGM